MDNQVPLPWVEKYRPNEIDELLSHHDIILTLKKFIESGQLPHLLFHGPPGTGKTSTIHAISKFIYKKKKNQMVLEMNASDDRGINIVRDAIKNFAESASTTIENNMNDENSNIFIKNNVKIIILDEADMMTSVAQMALRRIMEKYSENVRFCIICNYVNKITPAIQSRCTRFRFSPLLINHINDKVKDITLIEGIYLTDDGLNKLFYESNGDMRKILNILQSCYMSNYNNINNEQIIRETISKNDFKMDDKICTFIDSNVICRNLGILTDEQVKDVLNTLLNSSIKESFNLIFKYNNDYGYSTKDLLNLLYYELIKIDWPNIIIGMIITRLADIEYRLSKGCNETIQSGAIVSAFHEIRIEIEKNYKNQVK